MTTAVGISFFRFALIGHSSFSLEKEIENSDKLGKEALFSYVLCECFHEKLMKKSLELGISYLPKVLGVKEEKWSNLSWWIVQKYGSRMHIFKFVCDIIFHRFVVDDVMLTVILHFIWIRLLCNVGTLNNF